ncbi:MAG: DAK2 domain-containing protein [Bacilli bacterium]|nr:DAK2 domain-containing protein [Bacilli bacterium]
MNYSDYTYLDGEMFSNFVNYGALKLKKHLQEINDLNVFPIPDGDTGDNMYRTIKGGIDAMNSSNDKTIQGKAKALADGMLLNARGNSGVILSQIFAGLSIGFDGIDVASISDIVHAFSEGVRKAYAAVLPPTEGTILTVAREAYEEANNKKEEIKTLGEFSKIYLDRMYESLENTPELLAVLKEAGVIDSGGAGLYLICTGARDAICDELHDYEALDNLHEASTQTKNLDFSLFTEDSVLEFGYCTEILLRLMNSKVNVKEFNEQIIIDYLNSIGDSLVCFKTGSIVKVHVHTTTPDKVLAFCQQFGEFLTIKIENMTLQHNEVVTKEAKKESIDLASLPKAKKAKSKFSTIVVCDGDGIIAMFKDLGVDYAIDGGQGHNPAIADFIEAFNEVNAENIYVFPNNSNIKMAAQQAKELYKDANVYVIPTANIGEAYSAISMLDYSYDDPDDVYKLFMDNYNQATTLMMCKATRDVVMNDVNVIKDNYIAFENKKIVSSAKTIEEVFMDALKNYEASILTIFYGKGATLEQKERIKSELKAKYPTLEYYELDGNQETFDCVAIIE